MARRPDLPRHVAVGRLDLDDVGAEVAERLGGIRPHQHGRHVDDLDALKWSHGVGLLPMRGFRRDFAISDLVTAARPAKIKGAGGMGVCAEGPVRVNVLIASRPLPGQAEGFAIITRSSVFSTLP